MKSLATWKLIAESISQDIPVMLLYVLGSSGSSPGRRGFIMAVNAFADMEGSLGGGIMEHKFVEMAKARLTEGMPEISLHRQVHNKTAATHQSGMICSGEQTILLYTLQKKDSGYINSLILTLEQYKNGLLLLSPAGIHFDTVIDESMDTGLTEIGEKDWFYSENIGYKNHLYIIGGGHCSLALSRIMWISDFYIHLFDDREALKTLEQNEFVHEKEVIEDYNQLAGRITPGEHTYIVIMTMGYRTDGIAVRALVNKNYRYLGLLGSKAKTARMLADLKNEGYNQALLDSIHAPIGMPIKSQTPEEVAISIAAEIIAVKNRDL